MSSDLWVNDRIKQRVSVVRATAYLITSIVFFSLTYTQVAFGVELQLSMHPGELIIGQNQTSELIIEAIGDDANQATDLRLACNVGTLGAPRQTGPRRWVATYHLPQRRFPQFALFLARAEGVDSEGFGAVTVPLYGETEIAFRTDPGSRVSVEVGSESFGPVRAARDGLVRVPVTVGPGQTRALASSIDALGNRNEQAVSLSSPDYPRTVISVPPRVNAGGEFQVALLSIERGGALQDQMTLQTTRGVARRQTSDGAIVLFIARAPNFVGEGAMILTVQAAGTEIAGTSIEIDPEEAHAVHITTDREAIVPGSDQSVTVHATVRDHFGNVRPDDPLTVRISGQSVETQPSLEGGVTSILEAPPVDAGLGVLVIEARSGDLIEGAQVRLVGGPAVVVGIDVPDQAVADGRTAVPIVVSLVGENGLPSRDRPYIRASTGDIRGLNQGDDGRWRASYLPRRANLSAPVTARIEAFRGDVSARADLRLTPPIPWFTIGLSGGLQTNIGGLLGPAGRFELSTRIGLSRGWIEICGHSGIFYSKLSSELSRGSSELRLFEVPLSVGFGYGLNLRGRLGLNLRALGGGLIVIVAEQTTFQPEARRLVVAPLVEGGVDLTLRVGRGEFIGGVGFGWATASEGSGLSGNLLGLRVFVGYRLFIL